MLTVGEALVDLLVQYEVDTIFGIPGTHSLELYRGIEHNNIRHILPRHEQGGGFMADGYSRSGNKPGVCFVITGPGVTNILTAVAQAYIDSVAMLVISPVNRPDAGLHNRGRLHEITDQQATSQPLTAFSATVNQAEDIPQLIARAFSLFSSQQPKPVHINIPIDILRERIEHRFSRQPLGSFPSASLKQIELAANLINNAQNPVIIAGGGARFASQLVIELAEKCAIPVTSTVAGRGVVPASHPLSVGAQLRAAAVQRLIIESDLVIVLGSELAQTDHYNDKFIDSLPSKQIRINLNTFALLGGEHSIGITSDVSMALELLIPKLSDKDNYKHTTQRINHVKTRLFKLITAKEEKHLQVLSVVQNALPDNAIVVSDMTQLAYTAIDYLPLERPNSWLHPTGYGTLGYALPAAMGVCLAKPQSPVLAIIGDSGFQYTMAELMLASELNLNLTILLWNNDALSQIRDDMIAANINPVAVTQINPDFMQLAKAFDCKGYVVDDFDQLKIRLSCAFNDTDKPQLIQLNENQL